MPLPSTITLNVGETPADVVYAEQSHIGGSAVVYYAPSSQGDLNGRPSLRFSHETTRNNVARSVVSFNTPVFDNEGVSKGFIKTDVVLNRPTNVSVDLSEVELEKVSKVLTETIRDIIAGFTL